MLTIYVALIWDIFWAVSDLARLFCCMTIFYLSIIADSGI